ncbi:hypothetical protein [Nocardia wallacei]|uniref:hypothetical protein n=1 Tax=Nocardia wallacei TaxID=480035 RepID=UPI002456AF60|nr:hypothetical protein [Nocardia wallacei]
MLNRVIMLSMLVALIPTWGWIILVVVVLIILIMLLVVVVTGSTTEALSSDFHYQCDSAIGPDSAVVRTEQPVPGGDESRYPTQLPSAAPTTNPYASLTAAPDDKSVSAWQRTCLTAMRAAPYQLPPLRSFNNGPASECARQLALSKLQGGGSAQNAGGESNDAALARSVIAQASATLVTGRCDTGGATGQDAARSASAAGAGGAGFTQGGCAAITNANVFPTVVVLPVSVAGQAACGQRVAVSAMSAGDLVFWDFRDNAPTRVGVAVGGAQLVTVEPGTGQAVQQFVPANADVRVKRVLRGAA